MTRLIMLARQMFVKHLFKFAFRHQRQHRLVPCRIQFTVEVVMEPAIVLSAFQPLRTELCTVQPTPSAHHLCGVEGLRVLSG